MMLDELLHRFDHERFEVSVAFLEDGTWPERLRAEGFDVSVVPQTRWRDLSNVRDVTEGLADLIRRNGIDLVHASGNGPLLCATLAAKRAKTPIVWVVFDALVGFSPRKLLTARRQVSARLLGALHPDFVIFGTARSALRTPLRRSTPTEEILPGIDLDRHGNSAGDGGRARRELGIDPDAPLLAMFGRLTYLKSQTELLRSLGRISEAHPAVRAVICGGESDRAYAARLRALRSELHLEDRVVLTGFVPDQLRDDVMAAADVVVHLAKRESFGLAVVEAQAAGKTVVAFDATGPRSLIEDGVTGALVPVDDLERLATVISALLADPARRAAIGAAAATSARAHPIEGMVERIEGVWQRVAANGKSARRRRPASP
jgi:glycosyltransferase involved in cell wall biosynthesis